MIQELPDEVLVYDLERDRAHCLNETAAFVWQHCDGRNTAPQIARSLANKVKVPVDEKVVWYAIDQLRRNCLMLDGSIPAHINVGLNRRQMVQALGLAAAVALPVVASIVAPTPAQASTCLGTGAACTTGVQCCSGICNTPSGTCT